MFTASIGKYLYSVGGLQPEAWVDAATPELRPGGGDAATARALGSASVSIVSRRGGGRIELAWRHEPAPGRRPRFLANASVPHGFAAAALTMPLPSAGGRVSFTLRERLSGLEHRCAAPAALESSDGLRRAGVLGVSLHSAGDQVELLITPGKFEFSVE
jgi:hypothetical protein